MTTESNPRIPVIACCGTNGRAVIFGYVDRVDGYEEPVIGEPVTLHDARMVIYWDSACGGLFGLAASGPKGSTRISAKVAKTVTPPVAEWLTCEAHEEVASWPAA